jgi:hypothetical protein
MKKISVWGMNMLLAVDLEGIYFYEELLSKLHLEVDKDNNIQDWVIDNIKSSIKVAVRFAIKKDNDSTPKLKRALRTLLDYGTEESSNDIRNFLESQESNSPLIISGMSTDCEEESIGNFFILAPEVKEIYKKEATSFADFLCNRAHQDFSRI